MIAAIIKAIGRMLKSFWRGITVLRQFFLNLIFLVILVVVLSFLFADIEKGFPDNAALILSPQGVIVEQESEKVLAGELFDQSSRSETLLQDLILCFRIAFAFVQAVSNVEPQAGFVKCF